MGSLLLYLSAIFRNLYLPFFVNTECFYPLHLNKYPYFVLLNFQNRLVTLALKYDHCEPPNTKHQNLSLNRNTWKAVVFCLIFTGGCRIKRNDVCKSQGLKVETAFVCFCLFDTTTEQLQVSKSISASSHLASPTEEELA